MGAQDQGTADEERSNPYEGIRPLSAPHDPEVPQEPDAPRGAADDDTEDLRAASGLLGVDPLDPIKRGQQPGESQPGPDPTLPPIPPS